MAHASSGYPYLKKKYIYIYDWVDNPSNSLRTFYNQVVAFNLDDR